MRKLIKIIILQYGKMRNVFMVVGDIYEILLQNKTLVEHSDKKDILHDVKNLYDSLCYAPPETINSTHYFGVLQDIMNYYVSQDDYVGISWCRQCIDIFLDPNYGSDKFS